MKHGNSMTKVCVLSILVFLLTNGIAYAGKSVLVTDFTNWTQDSTNTGPQQVVTPDGKQVLISAQGSSTEENWGGLYKSMKGTIGMKATINVSSVSGNTQAGIMDSLGMIGKNRIQCAIFFEQNSSDQNRIRWRIRSKDTSNPSATWVVLATGTFGDMSNPNVRTGQNITVTMKRSGNEIWFNVDGYPSTVKWAPTSKMTALNWSPEVFGWANKGDNSISATISNVYILY